MTTFFLSKYNILIGKLQIELVRITLTDDTHIYTYIYVLFCDHIRVNSALCGICPYITHFVVCGNVKKQTVSDDQNLGMKYYSNKNLTVKKGQVPS